MARGLAASDMDAEQQDVALANGSVHFNLNGPCHRCSSTHYEALACSRAHSRASRVLALAQT
jgi:uncharacterized protein YcbX